MLLVLLSLPACAARLVTVEQIRQTLAGAGSRADAKVAAELADLEPTERISPSTLEQIEKEVPGPRSQETLLQLADASAFLPLPDSEKLDVAAPDAAGMRTIIDNTIQYLGKTIPNLPNFVAVRDTIHFEDSPLQGEIDNSRSVGSGVSIQSISGAHLKIGRPYSLAMYSTGKTSSQVTYRAGREVPTADQTGAREAERMGLTTRGEFGPILAIVVSDALRNKLFWDHWEAGAGEPVAVFHYTVPESGSHYAVAYPSENGVKRITPAYHGLLAIDPGTGSVLRLTVIADMQPPYELVQVGIVVEYGPVGLGDKVYVCPLHAVVISREPTPEEAHVVAPPLRTCLNDVTFTRYHLFHAETRILSSAPQP